MIRLKVYGTTKGEKRFTRKGRYYTASRDKKGHFKTCRKWSPKYPNIPDQYREIYAEAKTGKELMEKVQKQTEKYQWTKGRIETDPYPELGEWLEKWLTIA